MSIVYQTNQKYSQRKQPHYLQAYLHARAYYAQPE